MRLNPKKILIVDQALKNAHGHHLEYSLSVAQAAHRKECSVIVGVHEDFEIDVAQDGIEFCPRFSGYWDASESFTKDLFELIDEKGLASRDHVFIHTIGMKDAIPLLTHLNSRISGELFAGPTLHILMRRDPREYPAELKEELGCLLHEFASSAALSEVVKFYTDTDELTALHDVLSSTPFQTLPIPVRHGLAAQSPVFSPKGVRPLVVGYLGDARPEKGFHLLPDLVSSLWFSHVETNQIRFRFQSNFNLPGGEPGMVEALNKLHQYPNDRVELIEGPFDPEFYYELLGSTDIVLVLQDPLRYQARSSGILNEALLAGKPVVVPANSWMSNQIDPSRATIFRNSGELSQAVAEAVEKFESLFSAASHYSHRWAEKHSPDRLVDLLLEKERTANPKEQRNILFIFNADYVCDNTGAAQVFYAQLNYMQAAGYAVHGFGFSLNARHGEHLLNWSLQVRKRLRDFGLTSLSLGSASASTGSLDTDKWLVEQNKSVVYSFKKDMASARQIGIPSSVLSLIKREKIDAVFLNYACNMPIVESLPLDGVPVITELLDIQAFHEAMSQHKVISEASLDYEAAIVDRSDVAIFLNPIEADKLKPRLRHAFPVTVAPPSKIKPPTIDELAGPINILELIAGLGTDRNEFTVQYQKNHPDICDVKNARKMQSIDLLFVSSNHLPNVRSYIWFYENIYLKFLKNQGVTLCIAGSICYSDPRGCALPGWGDPNVLVAGRVQNLDALYAAAKIVVIPVIEGAGYSAKTTEALAAGKPVVTTSAGMRGLRFDPQKFPVFNAPDKFAARLFALLENPALRLAVASEGQQIGMENSSFSRYAASMDAAFEKALGDRALRAKIPPAPDASLELIEWSPAIGVANDLIRAWIERRPFDRKTYTAWHSLQDPPDLHKLRVMFRAMVERRTAPFLSRGHGFFREADNLMPMASPWTDFELGLTGGGRGGVRLWALPSATIATRSAGSQYWSNRPWDDFSLNGNALSEGSEIVDHDGKVALQLAQELAADRTQWLCVTNPSALASWRCNFDIDAMTNAAAPAALSPNWGHSTGAGRLLLSGQLARARLPVFRDAPLELTISISPNASAPGENLDIEIWIDDGLLNGRVVRSDDGSLRMTYRLPALPAEISSGSLDIDFRTSRDDIRILSIDACLSIEHSHDEGPVPVAFLDWMLSLHPEEYVHECYARILGRKADPEGLQSYLTAISKGVPRNVVFLSILSSQEYAEHPVRWLEREGTRQWVESCEIGSKPFEGSVVRRLSKIG